MNMSLGLESVSTSVAQIMVLKLQRTQILDPETYSQLSLKLQRSDRNETNSNQEISPMYIQVCNVNAENFNLPNPKQLFFFFG